jgi:phage-related protein
MSDSDEPAEPRLKDLVWVRSCRKDLKQFPEKVRRTCGYALWRAQLGELPREAKVLKGFKSAGVLEIIEDWQGNTYRVVYTVRFAELIYVLHAFQKKSKKGSKTPVHEIDRVRKRLKAAEEHYAEWKANKEKQS